MTIIDLKDYSSPATLVMSGRPKGEELRAKLQLDSQDVQPDPVSVNVPEQIVSLNSSFFLGLFAKSVQRLGAEGFDKKYKFTCNQAVRVDIEAGKRKALITTNPLPKLK